MVFSSLQFLFVFLPIVLFMYFVMQKYSYGKYCGFLLFCASVFYYAYWNPIYLVVIVGSMLVNFCFGQAIYKSEKSKKAVFVISLTLNIVFLGYFKYTDFLIGIINSSFSAELPLANIVLPIGISFFTFQQIAYLSDIYMARHDPTSEGLTNYGLFVTFFPQLVAGPIVHHKEMMPQFVDANNRIVNWQNIHGGLCFLSIGLAKKVLIADTLSPVVKYCFDSSAVLTFLEACFGSVAYTLQLYFDFSGYTDMAIGCALFFNINLPQNFNSPYRAVDIQDFWRRWHMTLSRWLKDYLYIPLGGSRRGTVRTLVNLFLTFLIGGIWHGAGWTFMLWGGLHGSALVIHRIWSQFLKLKLPPFFGWILTFSFVNLAWIPFRALNFANVQKFIDAFYMVNGFGFRSEFKSDILISVGFDVQEAFYAYYILLLAFFLLSVLGRNSIFLILRTKVSYLKTLVCSILFMVATVFLLIPEKQTEFIYFQF